MVKLEAVNPKDVWNPDFVWQKFAAGETKAPAGWSQIAKIGNIAFIAGQVGATKDGKMPGDVRGQLELVYENLDKCLKAINASWSNVLHLWCWSTTLDMDFYNHMREVQAKYIPKPPFPAMSGIGVTRLTWRDQKVEIGALVVLS